MKGVQGVYVDGEHIVNLQPNGDIIGEMSMIAERACAAKKGTLVTDSLPVDTEES